LGKLWAAGAALVAAWPCPSNAAVLVEHLRISSGPASTRVVLDLSGATSHHLFSLANPDRIVVDIPAARLGTREALPPGEGPIRQFRTAQQSDGSLRIVLDLNRAVAAQAFMTPPSVDAGHRLVIDLDAGGSRIAAAPLPSSPPPRLVKSLDRLPHPDRDIVIAIDAGHGGQDPGAIGRGGTREKDVTLAIARRLKAHIDHEPGMRAVLTRNSDHFVILRDRIQRARADQADMFVSVHADAVRDRTVAGSSIYVLSARGATDEAALWLARRENAADLVGGVTLDDKDDVLASVLIDLSQGASMSASISAAEHVLGELYRVGNVRRREVQHAGFVVLKSPDIPSMLVETAFISNPQEEVRLRDVRHQERLAAAIHAGVRAYFYASPPPGTRIAALKSQGRGTRHVAARGDTLSTIATRYQVSLSALKAANGLRGDRLAVGQELEIPGRSMH
jgi:N-acetylmuramoyl-L-alanine amidase